MNKVKKNKKKGFTLVELMIVVVIMVILAAAASPIFKGYLDRAKQARYLAECRTVYVAAQTVAQDFLIADQAIPARSILIDSGSTPSAPSTNPTNSAWLVADFAENVLYLAGMGKPATGESYTINFGESGDDPEENITSIVYETTGGLVITFKPNSEVKVEATAPTT